MCGFFGRGTGIMNRLHRLEKQIEKLRLNVAPHAYIGFIIAVGENGYAIELCVWERGKCKTIIAPAPDLTVARQEMDRLLTLYPPNNGFFLNVSETPLWDTASV